MPRVDQKMPLKSSYDQGEHNEGHDLQQTNYDCVEQAGKEPRTNTGYLVTKSYIFRGLNIKNFFRKGHV
jgi:hypothetical protein